jgi:2-haloacid dehalogenase
VPFDAVITAEQARRYKPHKPIFEEALQRLGAEPGSVMHVAEGVTEIAPMRQLGCTTVWVRRNGRSARLTEAPDLEVPDLRSLLPMLASGAGS